MKKNSQKKLNTPWQKLMQILHYERSNINYIFLYAIFIGLLGLTLPLGTAAVFNLLSNGALYSSTFILIAVILIGVVVGGVLLIGQLSLVEVIEQKIFAKAALEFAYRLPRIKKAALENEYPPELVNRFFDILTIQKGLTKLLVDIIAAAVLIFFSTILLSFYHPLFIVLGLLIIIAIIIVLWIHFKAGVDTSLEESAYKYELVSYLEKVADDLEPYRQSPAKREEVISQADEITSNYLGARNDHFTILRRFFASAIILRTLLMGGLLLLGSYFVVTRQMSFGQFVAAEVIIVQISYAIEKLMTNMNTVFDMATASEKLSVVTDLELEQEDTRHA